MKTTGETYRERIARLARAMATAQKEAVHPDLAEGFLPLQVALFVDGNLDKRYDKLEKQLETVAPAFEDFESLLIEYIRSVLPASYDIGASDGERMLCWLESTQQLTPVQRDYIACQRARHCVEELARRKRLAHVQFQDLLSLSESLAGELDVNEGLRIHLNPIRVWSRFETAELLEDGTDLPADVLFFAVEDYISTAAIEEDEGRVQLAELERWAPCTLGTWTALSEIGDREALAALTRDLAAMGLVAFG